MGKKHILTILTLILMLIAVLVYTISFIPIPLIDVTVLQSENDVYIRFFYEKNNGGVQVVQNYNQQEILDYLSSCKMQRVSASKTLQFCNGDLVIDISSPLSNPPFRKIVLGYSNMCELASTQYRILDADQVLEHLLTMIQ